jgi:prolyl oligopeptidase
LIDPNPLSADRTTSANLLGVSDDGTLLAYGLRQGGEDEVAIRLFDVERRKDLADQLPRGRYMGLSITPDKSGFYYSRYGPQGSRVYFHTLGKDPGADPEIFGKGYTPDKGVSGRLTEDGRYFIFQVSHGSAADKVEIYFQDLVKKGPITPVVNDITARFSGHAAGSTLYMLTNWQAPNGRILAVDLTNPARERWREIIPAGQAVLEGFSAAGGKLFITCMENVQSTLKIFSAEGKHLRDVPMPAIGRIGGVSGRWSRNEAFFQFDSFHIPGTIYRYDIAGDRQEVWARLNVPIDAGRFETKQVWYPSKDGTKIPMFLFHRKGLKLDGARPVFLTGYGGFNLNRTAEFSPTAVLWAEQGGVFALPNLRGGGEFGEGWHRAGMLASKQNVFDDFIAAAQWLIKAGYTSPAKLAISGRSNGGLLVGAALTQRPDLFRAVVCGYPLLDMIRYQKFLIARFWVPEYGSSDNPDQFKFIYAYSPYHHVKPGTKYPAVLFVTGDSDTRVAPLHARKMAALLQAATGSDRPVLLHYDTKAGHTRGMPMGKQIDDLTDELSFLLWQLESSHD